jgi:hypothetical protein
MRAEGSRARDRMERETSAMSRAQASRFTSSMGADGGSDDRGGSARTGRGEGASRSAATSRAEATGFTSATRQQAEAADRAQHSASLERMRAEGEAARERVMREAAPMNRAEASRHSSSMQTRPAVDRFEDPDTKDRAAGRLDGVAGPRTAGARAHAETRAATATVTPAVATARDLPDLVLAQATLGPAAPGPSSSAPAERPPEIPRTEVSHVTSAMQTRPAVDPFDAALDAAIAAAGRRVGNAPGADFVLGEPLSEGRRAEILSRSAETVAANATRMAGIDAEVEARVTLARETRDPEFRDRDGRGRFQETRARETFAAVHATERASLDAGTQQALRMAALVDPVNGLAMMRETADAALAEARVPQAARAALRETGALSETGYQQADAFRRAAEAWAAGSADMASHPIDPEATTARYAEANPLNRHVAANLDDILERLSGAPELAADMRLYAATQLGDAIHNAETGNHGALISQISGGQATSAEALALQREIGATQEGREALRQLQVLFSPADLANQYSRTGEMDYRGVLNLHPGTSETPMGGYPEVIRDTIGPGIGAAMDARGLAGIAMVATVVLPGPEDLAIVAGARALGGLYRGARLGPRGARGGGPSPRPGPPPDRGAAGHSGRPDPTDSGRPRCPDRGPASGDTRTQAQSLGALFLQPPRPDALRSLVSQI